MIAFYGSRLSEHMIRTPEGYLICKDVPIARTGTQEYRGSEFGGADSEKIYKVARPEEYTHKENLSVANMLWL